MTDARLQRESEFHNKAFTENTRAAASKFYIVAEKAKRQYHALINKDCAGKQVLEYGCGKGSYAFGLAGMGANVAGIDISDEGIELATTRAREEGLQDQLSFQVMNAEELEFPDDHFDIVCGSGILHHLDMDTALKELTRVLKPQGHAVFFEPLGHNIFINLYRKLTPQMRSDDEHPLLMRDLKLLSKHFQQTDFYFYNLCTLAAVPFRSLPGFKILLGALGLVDRILLSLPPLQKQAWIVVSKMQGPK